MGGVCPEVSDICTELGFTTPSKQRLLQRLYDRCMENAQTDFDFGGYVLTYLRRSGSRPVDLATGERATKHLMGAMR